eukprot:Opistho-2@29507
MRAAIIFVAACLIAGAFAKPTLKYNTGATVKDGKLNVHLVAHTHDDVGWLKTVDQYYMGSMNYIQHAGVQYIIDSVMKSLTQDPNRKFIYVEIAFFSRWWNEQSDETKDLVRGFVREGRLEFINGGWCMNDEATTHYVDIIDQMTLGHRFLMEEFGVRPRIGWHIDPFGHSNEQASLFARMGFDGFFFGRIDYQDKNTRLAAKNMETIWKGSSSLGAESQIFAGTLFNGYGPPDGFCFDQFCDDAPIQDDERIEDYNVKDRVDAFVAAALDQASHYKTDHIVMTMGSDFQFENANEWFKNLDKLIHYVNLDGRINALYSTPSIYLDALHASNQTWSTKEDDFFPYADCPHCYWTGYFASRMAIKGYVRWASSYLQTCRQLEVASGIFNGQSGVLAEAMGIAQHHDAVSGTEKQHVANDYARRLAVGQAACESLINDAIAKKSNSGLSLSQCPLLNVTLCDASAKAQGAFVVAAYNPLPRARTETIRFPVSTSGFAVVDASGNSVVSQVVPSEDAAAKYILTFDVQVPALGFVLYTVSPSASEDRAVFSSVAAVQEDRTVDNGAIRIVIDGVSGRIKSIDNLVTGETAAVTQDFLYYEAFVSSFGDTQASGAYIFRPAVNDAKQINNGTIAVTIVDGPVVKEIRQTFAPWLTQTIRLYAGQPWAEFEHTVGPIPTSDNIGKEVISRFTTDLDTQGVCYTDSNGREMQLRKRDFRPTWTLQVNEAVSGNYYPVNSRAAIRDANGNRQFTVLTDRSCGGGSIVDGQLELMIHRRLTADDSRGVGEPLDEPGEDGKGLIVRSKHFVVLSTGKDNSYSADIPREVASRVLFPLTLAFGAASELASTAVRSFVGLRSDFPANVNLITLERLDEEGFALVRLEHAFAANESPKYSVPITLALKTLLAHTDIEAATELTLSANMPLSTLKRLVWATEEGRLDAKEWQAASVLTEDLTITLNPMEIRTFLVKYSVV